MSSESDLLSRIRRRIKTHLAIRTYRKYGTNMTPAIAAAHFAYHRKAQAKFDGGRVAGVGPDIRKAAALFSQQGVASFSGADCVQAAREIITVLKAEEAKDPSIWDATGELKDDPIRKFPQIQQVLAGTLGDFVRCVFKSEFKIYYMKLFKVERNADAPSGSQLWHVDGGPGTCMNVLYYLDDTYKENGALECVPWTVTRQLIEDFEIKGGLDREKGAMSKTDYRAFKAAKCEEMIRSKFSSQIVQPEGKGGLMVAFRNNLFHRGGFPDPGKVRYALVFHVYPSDHPLDPGALAERGAKKYGSYPDDPAF